MRNRAVFHVESRDVFERLHHLAPPLERVEPLTLEDRVHKDGPGRPAYAVRATWGSVLGCDGTTTEDVPGDDERD